MDGVEGREEEWQRATPEGVEEKKNKRRKGRVAESHTRWCGRKEGIRNKGRKEIKKKTTPEGVGEKKNGEEPEWKKRRMARKAIEDKRGMKRW